MQHIKSTAEVTRGMVILSGSYYYKVLTTGPRYFCGRVWDEERDVWGPIRTVPLPSSTHFAYEVTDTETMFPENN